MRVGEHDVERVGTLPADREDRPATLAPRLSKSTTAPEPSSTSISDTSLSLSRTTGLAGDRRSRTPPSLGTHACTNQYYYGVPTILDEKNPGVFPEFVFSVQF